MLNRLFYSDILFTGYYGQFNTGDDAFLEVASWGAKKYWNKTKNVFLANKKNLPITKNEVMGYPFNIPKTYRLQNRLLLPNTRYLISAGGSTLSQEIQKNDIKRLAIERKKKNSELKIGGIGVSIGPFANTRDEKCIINYLRNLDFLSVRDQASYDFAISLNLPYKVINSFDLASLLPEIYNYKIKKGFTRNRKIIGISVCPYESIIKNGDIQAERNRNEKLVKLLQLLDKRDNIHFKFLVFNGHKKLGDLSLTNQTIKTLSPSSYEVIRYTKNTLNMWKEVASCDFVITTRLHAAVFACFSDTPFLLNEYHKKCGDFLDNIGYDNHLRFYDDNYDINNKAQSIIEVLNESTTYSEPTRKDKMKEIAMLNFTAVKNIVL